MKASAKPTVSPHTAAAITSGGSESHAAGFAAIDEAAALHRLRRRLVRLELGLLVGVRLAHHGHGALRLEERHFATTKSRACAQTRDAVGRKLARRHLRPGAVFLRVGLHTSRRRAADAPAPLERAPTSERGVAGQLPRPARRSKKWPVRRGLRGRAARGGVFMPVLLLYNTTSLFRALDARGGLRGLIC